MLSVSASGAPRLGFSNWSRRHCLQSFFGCSSIVSSLPSRPIPQFHRTFRTVVTAQTQRRTMSYSNTSTSNADPYKEKAKDEPGTEQKIEDLVAFVKGQKFGMMTTKNAEKNLLVSRCMAVAATEHGGVDLIFHTNTESGKTDDLDKDSSINMAFINGSGEWASISGKASIIVDRDVVHKYYSPALKAWVGDLGDGKHDGGPDDPRIGVIKIEAKTATYALSKSNAISRGIEIVSSAITGNTADVNKLREISEQEISQYRSSH